MTELNDFSSLLCRCPEKIQLHKKAIALHRATTGSEIHFKLQFNKQVICFHITPHDDEALCYSTQGIRAVIVCLVEVFFCLTAIGSPAPQLILVMM